MDYRKLKVLFEQHFANVPRTEPRLFRSPGRINIIGEHTDYNGGFVLPAGVDKEIALYIAPSGSNAVELYSADKEEKISSNLQKYTEVTAEWARYPLGVLDQLLKLEHKVGGFYMVFGGNIPMGAGMSSSAALECATVFALNELFNLKLNKFEMVKLAQQAENQFVGVNCGIMDQFASIFAAENTALKLDCRDLTYKGFSLNLTGYQLILVDSMVKHSLASSEYNTRRAECEEGLRIIQQSNPTVVNLRDVTLSQLEEYAPEMRPVVYQRCQYVIKEIQRVVDACQALEQHNLQRLGFLLYETHEGLQHNYEVSCPELDFLVDFTRELPEVLGARMMGGGFGGCTINLVESQFAQEFTEKISVAYKTQWSQKPAIYPVKTATGASEIKLTETQSF